jgi:hypothetical protein
MQLWTSVFKYVFLININLTILHLDHAYRDIVYIA